jgi:hypothetical protein
MKRRRPAVLRAMTKAFRTPALRRVRTKVEAIALVVVADTKRISAIGSAVEGATRTTVVARAFNTAIARVAIARVAIARAGVMGIATAGGADAGIGAEDSAAISRTADR